MSVSETSGVYTALADAELHDLLATAGITAPENHTRCDKGLDGTYADWIALAEDG